MECADDDGMIGFYRSERQGLDAPAGYIFQGDHTEFTPYPESCANWCRDNESCIGFWDSAGWCYTYEAPLSPDAAGAAGVFYLKCSYESEGTNAFCVENITTFLEIVELHEVEC